MAITSFPILLFLLAPHSLTNSDSNIHSDSALVYFPDSNSHLTWKRAFEKLGVHLIHNETSNNESLRSFALPNADNLQLVWLISGELKSDSLDLTADWHFRINRIPGSKALTSSASLNSFIKSSERIYTSFGRHSFLLPRDKHDWFRTMQTNQKLYQNHMQKYRDKFFLERFLLRPAPESDHEKARQAPWRIANTQNDVDKILETMEADAIEVMEYIEPFLLDNHRFVAGFYVIVTCLDPLRIYLHSDVLLRIARDAYPSFMTASSSPNSCNINVDYISPWEFPDLQEKLEQMEAILKEQNEECNVWDVVKQYLHAHNLDMFRLQEEIENTIIVAVLNAHGAMLKEIQLHQHTRPQSQYDKEGSNFDDKFFELYKFDMEIDYNGHVKLLQIHSNPLLESDRGIAKEEEFFRRLAENVLGLIGVHPKANPTFESILNRPGGSQFCSDFCRDTQRAFDTACWRCPEWFSPSVAFRTLTFAHELSRRGSFGLLYPSIEKDFTKFKSSAMSAYDYALDRYVKSLYRAYSNDMAMMSLEKVPICVFRQHCNGRGDCINGECVCDDAYKGNNCYQAILETQSSRTFASQWMQLQSAENLYAWNFSVMIGLVITAILILCLWKRNARSSARTQKVK